jgi:hypothetical protein
MPRIYPAFSLRRGRVRCFVTYLFSIADNNIVDILLIPEIGE